MTRAGKCKDEGMSGKRMVRPLEGQGRRRKKRKESLRQDGLFEGEAVEGRWLTVEAPRRGSAGSHPSSVACQDSAFGYFAVFLWSGIKPILKLAAVLSYINEQFTFHV
jgi:hypothetical protein